MLAQDHFLDHSRGPCTRPQLSSTKNLQFGFINKKIAIEKNIEQSQLL